MNTSKASPARRPVGVDVFSGVGGMSLGFEGAGFDVAVAVDNDPVHLGVYGFNFPFAGLINKPVDTVAGDELLGHVDTRAGSGWDGRIDCLFGGPPCQSFSNIGQNNPADQRRFLVDEFARLVVETCPRSFVMENVPGLLQPKHRPVLNRVVEQLHEAGYVLAGHGPVVLNAARFGVPQKRRRVFLIGFAGDVSNHLFLIPPSRGHPVTVGDAIGNMVNVDDHDDLLHSDETTLPAGHAEQLSVDGYVSGLRKSAYGKFGVFRRWNRNVLTSSMRTVHNDSTVKRYRRLRPGETDPVTRQPRLRSDGLSPTLRAGTGIDRGGYTSCRPVHPDHPRVITVREGARLHGYPDWFRFHRTKWHGFRQLGNSVPPAMAETVAVGVIQTLGLDVVAEERRVELGNPDVLGFTLAQAREHLAV